MVDTRDRRDARILIGGNLRAPFLLIPIVNSTDERRNQGYSGFGARHSLGEAEEKRQIAVNAFFLKKLGCPNALPGAHDLDQDAFTRYTLLLVERDKLVCRKCAVRFGPMCAKVRLFNTGVKRLRAGLVLGKVLICLGESRKAMLRDRPTLNQ